MENTAKILAEAANSIGIALSNQQKDAFLLYLRVLQDENKITNIVANSEAQEIIWKHFIDSIAIPPILQSFFAEKHQLSLLDIGTGGGFPGIPLKIIYPGLSLDLMEATNKKAEFIRKVVQKLSLNNVNIAWGRAEEFGRRAEYREKYDVVVARALAELRTLVELTLPFVKKQGIFVAYKGPKYNEELAIAAKAILTLGGEVQDIIESEATGIKRAFVIIRKIAATPAKYPRRSGMPEKRPL
ncbi:MAG: 16S rRNA (guanine(527)-N(7))-methyltransferase RsmG [bacterium]|nr:16S rRNA (guanine(527)-N(7))-methyltransferase RsmG [bacterium]MDD5756568.1 16S rRNA (guanine(527)-N(7))-methyltransferase RsmG [bacterium]